MTPRTTPGDADGWFQRARIVWMAMFTAIGLYGVVLLLVTGDGGGGEVVPQLRSVLIALGAASGVTAWFVYHRIVARAAIALTPEPADETELQRRFGMAVVSWGFAETIALYGFVLALLERSPSEAVSFFVVAALALLGTRPRPELFSSRDHVARRDGA